MCLLADSRELAEERFGIRFLSEGTDLHEKLAADDGDGSRHLDRFCPGSHRHILDGPPVRRDPAPRLHAVMLLHDLHVLDDGRRAGRQRKSDRRRLG